MPMAQRRHLQRRSSPSHTRAILSDLLAGPLAWLVGQLLRVVAAAVGVGVG